jgi:glycosyltransferase involved in cell wall biosynthesis/ubiquinone/menaquinone biosynthesis C-methylase UbiE
VTSARMLSPLADQRAEYHYLYYDTTERMGGTIQADLSSLTERHRVVLKAPTLSRLKATAWLAQKPHLRGLVMALRRGWLRRREMALARRVLRSGRRVWLYWPHENAIECLDDERLRSLRRHWLLVMTAFSLQRLLFNRSNLVLKPSRAFVDLDELAARVAPVRMALSDDPTANLRVPGTGVYLRTDFWVKLDSGGSYTHTCYVAKNLSATTERLVCFLPHSYGLLTQWGIEQVLLDSVGDEGTERDLVQSTAHHYRQVRPRLQALRPSYIYERLCLGNFVGARLSRELGIPYIVEYNGSELSMARSFAGRRYAHEIFYLKAEAVAFNQATLISVVSDPVREELINRGVDARKILVNPNGADLDSYRPLTADDKRTLRQELGYDDSHRVVGFTGTFGGWHGVDVLAEAIPRICRERSDVRFLLIGDGNFRHLIDDRVRAEGLDGRVRVVGRVPQAEGARLLGACDIYVSPHHGHMINSRFFGSPTKVFEYMAMGAGIVASELEQIGEVLSPALRPADFAGDGPHVRDERAVLCPPGDLEAFVAAVIGLAARPDVATALGANARRAVHDHYSWERHVQRLWSAVRDGQLTTPTIGPKRRRIDTGDAYKDEVQNQWDNNPVGSQYVKRAQPHTLDWFLEVEAHRYGEYAPWMPTTMEFALHPGENVLEVGGGMGTDLAQFAKHGAVVTDVDLSSGHLELAKENFRLRGLYGRFIHHDAERLPFDDGAFDLVYSNGVIHHSPNSAQMVQEMYRVLKPGGRVIVMVYAENSLHYWYSIVLGHGLYQGLLSDQSVGEIMSSTVEMTANDARPLVKVYTKERVRRLFSDFSDVSVVKRQLTAPELPRLLRWMPLPFAGELMGWNLIVKGRKPERR